MSNVKFISHNADALGKKCGSPGAQNASLLSPIDSLPAELILDIFEISSTADGNKFRCHSFADGEDRPALTVSQVRKKWRQLAFNCPKLWSDLCVDLGHSFRREALLKLASGRSVASANTYPRLLQMFLDLSKDSPLKLKLYTPTEYGVPVWNLLDLNRCSQDMLVHLQQHAWHWGSLMCQKEDLASIPVPPHSLQQLTHLDLTVYSYTPDEVDVPPEWFSTAHNLKSIELCDVDLTTITFCWEAVDRLTISTVYDRLDTEDVYHDLMHISGNATQLRHLTFEGARDPRDFDPGETPIHFPMLETLKISGGFNLDWILAPKLHHLDISDIRASDNQLSYDPFNLANFLNRPNMALVSLKIESRLMEFAGQLLVCSKALRSLFSLHVEMRDTDTTQLSQCLQLDLSDASQVERLPALCEIKLSSTGNIYQSFEIDNGFVSMLESRCRSSCLCLLTLEQDSAPIECLSAEIRDRLQTLHRDGLSLCFNGSWSPIPYLELCETSD